MLTEKYGAPFVVEKFNHPTQLLLLFIKEEVQTVIHLGGVWEVNVYMRYWCLMCIKYIGVIEVPKYLCAKSAQSTHVCGV